MLAQVVPSIRYWAVVDTLERNGLTRAQAREAADRLLPLAPRKPVHT